MTFEDIEQTIFQFLDGNIPLHQFEAWVYQTYTLEGFFKPDVYLELISIDFTKRDARYNLIELLENNIDLGRYETRRVKNLLESLITEREDPIDSIENAYNLYCNGYWFLKSIGMHYIDGLDNIPRLRELSQWNESIFAQKRQLLNPHLDEVKPIASQLLAMLENRELKITGEYEYEIVEHGSVKRYKRTW